MVGNKRIAIIARMDDSGLGHQTRDLCRMLKPDKVLAIDFTSYNNFKQHPEWYKGYDTKYIKGFITDEDVRSLCKDVDIVITCETFYNNNFIDIANQCGVATVNQINYEFFEPLANRNLILPTKILMPSYWHLSDMKRMTVPGKVEHLPPPTFSEDYTEVFKHNISRTGKRRFLHVAGKMAAHDRAGTRSIIGALRHSYEDFELVIKIQSGVALPCNDPRVIFDYSSPEDERELYKGFDAMIQPRRYAGLNLPMNEALAAGLPVIMTDIEPNNKVLPEYWLVRSGKIGTFIARTSIDIYAADEKDLGMKLDRLATVDEKLLNSWKSEARLIAEREFGADLCDKYIKLIESI